MFVHRMILVVESSSDDTAEMKADVLSAVGGITGVTHCRIELQALD